MTICQVGTKIKPNLPFPRRDYPFAGVDAPMGIFFPGMGFNVFNFWFRDGYDYMPTGNHFLIDTNPLGVAISRVLPAPYSIPHILPAWFPFDCFYRSTRNQKPNPRMFNSPIPMLLYFGSRLAYSHGQPGTIFPSWHGFLIFLSNFRSCAKIY